MRASPSPLSTGEDGHGCPQRQEARDFATNVREDNKFSDLHGLALRIRCAARVGNPVVQIHQDRPVDLRKTGAAAHLIETLLMAA